jgi:uncharacterized FlaG/YvyC family protein
MASDGQPVQIPVTSLVHGSQAPTIQRSGNALPPSGKPAAAPAAKPSLPAQVAILNKFLNDSGKPDQFRVNPSSDDKLIQEINPATGEVIGEYPVEEFAELARSLGVSGAIIDSHA